MNVLVVGAGATGGLYGARLAQAGTAVTFLVRPRRAEVLRERGLRLTGVGEDEVITPRLVTAGGLSGPYDLVLLSVKSTALSGALDDLAPAVGPGSAVVPLLNGMAHLDELNARFGAGRVLGGVAKVATTLDDQGDIVRLAPRALLDLGEQDGRPSARVDAARTLLRDAGVDSQAPADIVAAMWHKWVFVSTVGALTCLMRGTVGDINAVPGGHELGPAVLAEAAAVSAAAGFPVPDDELAFTKETVTRSGVPFSSSLYRDVVAGLPTEADHIIGDLVDRARTHGVAVPLLDLAALHLRVHEHRLNS
ncbi:ketopantoate reductase family protein [Streptomyces sp. NPDC049597]|uniref:ketopantoate reductase family protein n=1 Tax=Streptomyces sp. NPDC049597 TaxID=3155276 RepID=UPI00342965A9